MTFFGKLLVIFQTLLAGLSIAVVALVLTHRDDWQSQGRSPEEAVGLVKRQEKIMQSLWATLAASESRWKTQSTTLDEREQAFLSNEDWYAAELAKTDKGDQPLQEVAYDRAWVALDPKHRGRPVMKDAFDWEGKPLRSAGFYIKELVATYADTNKAMKRQAESTAEETQLTNKMNGPKGLRQRVTDEENKLKEALAEIKEVDGLRTNIGAETAILLRRYHQLRARVDELEKAGYAATPAKP